MTPYEIYRYEAFHSQLHEDLRTVDRVNMRLFNQKRVKAYLQAVKKERPDLAETFSDENLLELMGVSYAGKPTLAGVISFSIYPQTYFPQLNISAVAVAGTEKGMSEQFLDSKRITGAIPEMLDEAVNFVRRNSQLHNTDGTKEENHPLESCYPIRAVREAVLNALLHRDYSVYTEGIPVSLELYRDRLVIRSSGGLYGYTSLEELGASRPELRNPVLSNIMERLKVSRNRYSGIPMMTAEMRRAGLPAPEFREERGEFVVVFRNQRGEQFELPKSTPSIPTTTPTFSAVSATPRMPSPRVEQPAPVVNHTVVPSFPGETERDEQVKRRIAEFCKTPRTRQELIEFTGVSRYYLIARYIQPMIEQKILAYTVPERPKSKFQKFVTVEQKK